MITAEEFVREKIRDRDDLRGAMMGLHYYDCDAEEALRWAHEFAQIVKKEAWNESILLSASSAEVSYDSDMSGRHYHVSKQSILKNLIP